MRKRLALGLVLASCSDATPREDEPMLVDARVPAMDANVVDARGREDAPADARVREDARTADAALRDAQVRPRSLPTLVEPHLDEAPTFNITRPTTLVGRAPVVVWANGGCLRSDFSWAPLFEHWASAGYVVLSLSASDLFGMIGSTSSVEHAALIDWVVAHDQAGAYAGKLDLERIVIAGNSCGGVTALEVAAKDARPAAVFVLSGSSAVGSSDEAVVKAITVPVGFVVGGDEDIAGANAINDYALFRDGLPAMIVHRREGDHVTVSTDANVLPQVADLALGWMELALFGRDELAFPNLCSACNPGEWRLESKNLETLRK